MPKIKNGRYCLFFALVIIVLSMDSAGADTDVRYANLGDFQLENGSVIRDCRVAYLTSGTLNADKSNVVLVPTWLAGTSRELIDIGFVGPGKIFDSSKYYIIAVESFGSGGSSSPSTGNLQQGKSFPQFSIRDVVRAQYILLARQLQIRQVRAVAGISMGAMAVFQWMVSYPDFMDQAVPILGGPWITSQEMLFWSAQLEILNSIGECKGSVAAMKALAPLHILQAWTPVYRAAHTSPAAFPAFLAAEQERLSKYDAANWAAQVKAIRNHDITKTFGDSREKAAAAVRAKCLVITSSQDQISSAEEARAFARLIGAQTAELDGNCGHMAFWCDREKLKTLVSTFLAANPGPSQRIPWARE